MTKPTEGPYKTGRDLFGGTHVYAPDGDRLTNDRMNGIEGWEATARLRAASWEMREALALWKASDEETDEGARQVARQIARERRDALLARIDGETE